MNDNTVRVLGHAVLATMGVLTVGAYAVGVAGFGTVVVAAVVVPFNMLLLEHLYHVEQIKDKVIDL